jgi:hypothetical protein
MNGPRTKREHTVSSASHDRAPVLNAHLLSSRADRDIVMMYCGDVLKYAGHIITDDAIPAELKVTESVGNAGEHSMSSRLRAQRKATDPTEDDVLGPYYRKLAPFQAKISPPTAGGEVLVVSGRVWSFRSKRRCPDACWTCGRRMRMVTTTTRTQRIGTALISIPRALPFRRARLLRARDHLPGSLQDGRHHLAVAAFAFHRSRHRL